MSDAQAERDARFMRRALRQAQRGQPSPRARAGAIVARGEQRISAGWNRRAEGPTASAIALARAGRRARGATLYVSYLHPDDLEPAGSAPAGAGGRLGRWIETLAGAGLSRLVIGAIDPELRRALAARRGRAALRVVLGVEAERCAGAVSDYRKWRERGLPEVTLKAAVTLDGRTAARSGESKWITGPRARREAHRLRARSDAVLVGIGTVLADDPELTVRAVAGRSPLRVVLDSELRTPLSSKLVRRARAPRTLIVHAAEASPARRRKLAAAGVELIEVRRLKRGGLDLRAALRALAERGVLRVLVEGGAHVHGALLDADLADRVAVFIAPCLLGDGRAIPLALGQKAASLATAPRLRELEVARLGPDLLVQGRLVRLNAEPR